MMKPCADQKKRIAWMALNVLNPEDARKLRAHLEGCPACGHYWREVSALCHEHASAAELLPEAPADETFHRRLRRRIAADEAQGAWQAFFPARPARRGLTAAAAVVALLALSVALALLWPTRQENGSLPRTSTSTSRIEPSAMISPAAPQPPTLSTYRMALNRSFDALDELLAEQAFHTASSLQTMTFSALSRTDLEN